MNHRTQHKHVLTLRYVYDEMLRENDVAVQAFSDCVRQTDYKKLRIILANPELRTSL